MSSSTGICRCATCRCVRSWCFPVAAEHILDIGIELHRLAYGAGLSITGDRNETVANPSSVRGRTGLPDTLDSSLGGTRGGTWIQDRYTVQSATVDRAGAAARLEHGQRRRRPVAPFRGHARAWLGEPFARRRRARPSARRGRGTCRASATRGSSSRNYFFDLSSSVVATLRHERATHLVTGFEKDLGADTLFRVEGYYKTFADLMVGGLENRGDRARCSFTLADERCLVRPHARQIRSRLFRRC